MEATNLEIIVTFLVVLSFGSSLLQYVAVGRFKGRPQVYGGQKNRY